ncbi:MAG: glycosyltransferase family 2 protein, partial [Bacteroidales bacterium]|nr:glycosyltransferase family 2 protein [Bacteroidales bacterium]
MCKVSVIIPVYRAKDTLPACLASVAAQTLDDLEAVLVDDHGGDGSIDVARSFIAAYDGPKRFRLTATPSNAGPGAARNCGIEAASGDYVAFLDSDDTLEADFCRRLYEAAQSADADLAVGSIVF